MARPSKFKKEFCDLLIAHMKAGNPLETFGAEIGVNKDTLYRWLKAHKEFSDAKKIGDSYLYKWWFTLGKGMAAGKVQGNASVFIFTMKNMFAWRDKVETVESDSFDDVDFVDE